MEAQTEEQTEERLDRLVWQRVRPRNGWVLVKSEPRVKQSKGGIVLPDGLLKMERMMEGTGVVLRMGSKVCDELNFHLEEGMRVCYRGFLKDASAWLFDRHEDGCQVFMIEATDLLAVVDPGVELGALS